MTSAILLIADLARSPGAGLVVEPVEPALGKAPAPFADRIRAASQPLNDCLVFQPVGRRQDNPGPPRPSLDRLPAPGLGSLSGTITYPNESRTYPFRRLTRDRHAA